MIKLKDIKVKGVCHPNIFVNTDKTLESVDIILYLDYKVDRKASQLDNYQLDEYELNNLEEEIASFMLVSLEGDTYKNLDKILYDGLDYRIVSDTFPGVEDTHQEVSDEQQQIAFNLIKEYVASKDFKKELDNVLNR